MNRSTPGLPVHHQLSEFTQTHVHRVSDAIQPSHPLSSPSPLAPNPSQDQSFAMGQLFAWGGQSTGVSALASFLPRNPRADLLQNGLVGSPCSPRDSQEPFQHYGSKASILQCSAFFIVQLSHPHMTTGKTIALTRRTFAGEVMSLFFNMLSRLVITFLQRTLNQMIFTVSIFSIHSLGKRHSMRWSS